MSESPTAHSSIALLQDPGNLARQVAQLESELERVRRQQREARDQWEEWIALLSHDLRTPLTLILAPADGLLRRYPDTMGNERLERDLRSIITGSRRLDKMIGQLVEGARLDVGRVVLQTQPIDLGAPVRDAVHQFRQQDHDHPIRMSVGRTLPLVQADPRRISTTVGSLLSNAALFSATGEPIRVAVRHVGRSVSVAVADRGVGITAEELPSLFEKHHRPERNRAVRREGLGLSLWIAHGIAQLHEGTLRAESAGADQGSTFSLDLPALVDDNA